MSAAMAGGKLRCCVRCGSYYTPTGAHQKYCPDCRLAVRAQKAIAQANREVITREASLRLLARVADWARTAS